MKLFNPDNVKMSFDFGDKDGTKCTFNDKVVLKLPESKSPDGNSRVGIYIPPVGAEYYPLKYAENAKLHFEMADGVVLTQSVLIDVAALNDNPVEGVTFSPDGGIEQMHRDLISSYGLWAFNQSVAMDVSEIKDNPVFKKAVEATRTGQRFCEWLKHYLAERDFDYNGTYKATKLPQQTIDEIKRGELVGLSMSVVCGFADAVDVSLDSMVGLLLQAGVLSFQEIQNGRDRAQKDVSGHVSGTRNIPHHPEPLA